MRTRADAAAVDEARLQEEKLDEVELCRRLIASAESLRHEDPPAAVVRAERARDLAASLEARRTGEGPWNRLQAEAWSVLASAHRFVGALHRAESCLAVALRFLEDARDLRRQPQLRPRIAQRAAYLRCDQGRFAEALELNAEAIAAYRSLGDDHLAACALLDRALVHHRAGRTPRAVELLSESLSGIDRRRAPRSYLAAVHNMAVYLQRLAVTRSETEEALHWLHLAIREHSRLPERRSVLKLRTLVALCRADLGKRRRAAGELAVLRRRFAEIGAASHEAVVLLHLVRLALENDDRAEARRLCGEIFPLLGRLERDDSARDTLLAFLAVTRSGVLDADAVRAALDGLDSGATPRT